MQGTKKIAGNINSDLILNKADKSIEVFATLLESEWQGEKKPFTQTISVDGVTEFSNGYVGLPQTSTIEQSNLISDSRLRITAQGEKTITITAYNKKPTMNIPIIITIIG